ncbi:glycosyltransferase family 2 protein [Flavobacterium piscis]|uniref:Glycosyltransferase involved in cell wall biosynthesis n=1 Tax=Flavobacterium piscis TaxID=1114874 RepID=A0ABU1Y3Z2_9FLAO|nr:glycosyltransferase family 2 protein [Flavobacterium piscis]MDR7208955.1 glycosyltransferase involved in cell wall biosynthesis [Flavobacterium piscis]
MLAIVVPYYKYTFFETTLKSLANQTNKNFKVYIGDDCSTENPMNLLEKYKSQIDFVYQKFDNNLGKNSLVQHWERCLNLSDAEEWFVILGDDDVLADNYIESFYNNIPIFSQEYNVVRFASCNIDENGKQTSILFQNPVIESSVDFFFKERRSSLSEYVFNKKKASETGFKDFPLAWCTDILAVLEISDFGNVYTINDSIAYIRVSDKSISGNKKLDKLKSQAAFDFLHYLLVLDKEVFNTFQRNELLKEIKGIYINDKKNINFFLRLSNYFVIRFLFQEYFNFLKQIFRSLNKSAKSGK